jgi:hypothetical protein
VKIQEANIIRLAADAALYSPTILLGFAVRFNARVVDFTIEK